MGSLISAQGRPRVSYERQRNYTLARVHRDTVRYFEVKNALLKSVSYVTDCVGRVAQSVWRLTTGWTVRDRIPMGTRFSARSERSWGPPSLL